MNRHNQDTASAFTGEGGGSESTLLPMLIGGLVLIVIGAAVISFFV